MGVGPAPQMARRTVRPEFGSEVMKEDKCGRPSNVGDGRA